MLYAKLLKRPKRIFYLDKIPFRELSSICFSFLNYKIPNSFFIKIRDEFMSVMKVLTIISTIFIPVTFIAGVYGMNFDYMPELHSRWGYIGVWVVMLTIMALMVMYFRRKKWL